MDCARKGKQKDAEVNIIVDMNGASVLPADMLPAIAGKKIELTLKMSEGLSWVIQGADIAGNMFSEIDLGVTKDVRVIPEGVLDRVGGGKDTVQIVLSHQGAVAIPATLHVDLGQANAGYYANLFCYNEEADCLDFLNMTEIDADGNAHLQLTRACVYSIIVSREPKGETYQRAI